MMETTSLAEENNKLKSEIIMLRAQLDAAHSMMLSVRDEYVEVRKALQPFAKVGKWLDRNLSSRLFVDRRNWSDEQSAPVYDDLPITPDHLLHTSDLFAAADVIAKHGN